jgi:magnesium chelatase family protein
MTFALVRSRALRGLESPAVTVEVHLANGLPSFTLVGLADTEVKESRERVRAALQTSGLEFPHNKRVTVSLAPADLPKESGRFDLPIALGILAAAGQIDAARLDATSSPASSRSAASCDRCTARWRWRSRCSARRRRRRAPSSCRRRAPTSRPSSAASRCAAPITCSTSSVPSCPAPTPTRAGCTSLVPCRAATRRRFTISSTCAARAPPSAPSRSPAAGQLSVLMVGPPGTGKSMLARRLAGLLPPLSHDEALESAAILSVAGAFSAARWGERVLRAPHHTASAAALVGGGSPPRPGEASLAHRGILFLDELAEFPRAALEALREPLETGRIVVSRAARQADFPAAFQLVAAMNPCPCGHLGNATTACRCTPDAVLRYQGKISGPLLDRIDIQIEVPTVAAAQLAAAADGEASAVVAGRVRRARERALERQGHANGELAGETLDRHCRLDEAASNFLQRVTTRLGWSARSFHRVLRVARTVADLDGHAAITTAHLGEAIQYRRALGAAG